MTLINVSVDQQPCFHPETIRTRFSFSSSVEIFSYSIPSHDRTRSLLFPPWTPRGQPMSPPPGTLIWSLRGACSILLDGAPCLLCSAASGEHQPSRRIRRRPGNLQERRRGGGGIWLRAKTGLVTSALLKGSSVTLGSRPSRTKVWRE